MLRLDGIAVDLARRTAGGDINANMWNAYERGERGVFYRYFVSQIVQGRHRAIVDRLEKFADWPQLLPGYCELFETLLAEASELGDENKVSDLIKGTEAGSPCWAFSGYCCALLRWEHDRQRMINHFHDA
jgi:hypothetical protein